MGVIAPPGLQARGPSLGATQVPSPVVGWPLPSRTLHPPAPGLQAPSSFPHPQGSCPVHACLRPALLSVGTQSCGTGWSGEPHFTCPPAHTESHPVVWGPEWGPVQPVTQAAQVAVLSGDGYCPCLAEVAAAGSSPVNLPFPLQIPSPLWRRTQNPTAPRSSRTFGMNFLFCWWSPPHVSIVLLAGGGFPFLSSLLHLFCGVLFKGQPAISVFSYLFIST